MTPPSTSVLITGYPGAGKSRLIEQLSTSGLPDRAIVEADGLAATEMAMAEAETNTRVPVGPVIAVADAVNLDAVVETSHSGAFARSQIAAADLVAIARADVIDAAPAMDLVRTITDRPVIDAREIGWQTLSELTARTPRQGDTAPPQATAWSYEGSAQLRARNIDAILEQRPGGLYRVSGQIRTETGGIAVEIVGRARATRPIADPGTTRLRVLSPGQVADRRAIDLWFTEAVSASTHMIGGFSWR